jgi:hypothetical protein
VGALSGGYCYNDAAGAASARWSAVPPVLSADSPVTVVVPELRADHWFAVRYVDGVQSSVVGLSESGFVACSAADNVADGVLLGALVGAVWIAGFLVRSVRSAL